MFGSFWNTARKPSSRASSSNGLPGSVTAAKRLEEDGISTAVVNARFVKPLDQDLIVEVAKRSPVPVACGAFVSFHPSLGSVTAHERVTGNSLPAYFSMPNMSRSGPKSCYWIPSAVCKSASRSLSPAPARMNGSRLLAWMRSE